MKLTKLQLEMLEGKHGYATQKSMEILSALGEIFEAEKMVPVTSVQIAGVSYANLGEPGLDWLAQMAKDGRVRVLTTLNPAGMDLENWRVLGIDPEFAKNQERVIKALAKMDIITTCTCTPYLVGNLPHYGEHIAWAESSAVCFANSVIGAKTNREGGPSALAAALTGYTPEYGYHLDKNRQAHVAIKVKAPVTGTAQFGTLGKVIGEILDSKVEWAIPYITGISKANTDELKAFCILAAVAIRLFSTHDDARYLLVGLIGLVGLATGVAITTFLRRPEIAGASTTSSPEAERPPSLLRRLVRTAESGAQFAIHYPSYILFAALAGRIEYYLVPYVITNALYALRVLATVALRFGRADAR